MARSLEPRRSTHHRIYLVTIKPFTLSQMPSVGKIAAKEVIFLRRTVVIYLFIYWSSWACEEDMEVWELCSFVGQHVNILKSDFAYLLTIFSDQEFMISQFHAQHCAVMLVTRNIMNKVHRTSFFIYIGDVSRLMITIRV